MTTTTTPPAPPPTITTATPDQIPSLSTIFARAFHPVNPYVKHVLPDTSLIRSWWSQIYTSALTDPKAHILVSINTSSPSDVIGVLCLRYMTPDDTSAGIFDPSLHPLTADHDAVAFASMIRAVREQRPSIMQGAPHFMIELLGVDHAGFKAKGVGTALLRRACEVADQEGVPVFVQANGGAFGFYQRCGFEVRGREILPGDVRYEEVLLVRRPRGVKVDGGA